jgi:hypothetical protein
VFFNWGNYEYRNVAFTKAWFAIVDIAGAYILMAWIGGKFK